MLATGGKNYRQLSGYYQKAPLSDLGMSLPLICDHYRSVYVTVISTVTEL